jgi:hypothetical protein
MQLFSVSIGEIEEDIVAYFVQTMGANPSSLTPATDLRKMFRFSAAAWAQLADTLSNQGWMLHIGVRLAQADMMTVSTVAQLSYLIFTRMRHVVVAATSPSVTPLTDLMGMSALVHPIPASGSPRRRTATKRGAAKTAAKKPSAGKQRSIPNSKRGEK